MRDRAAAGWSAPIGTCCRLALWLGTCIAVALGPGLLGHEGHGQSVRPRLQVVERASERFVIGMACVPAAPVVGEDVQCEFRAAKDGQAGGGRLVPTDVRLRARGTGGEAEQVLEAHREAIAGVYGVHHRFTAAGDYELAVAWAAETGRVEGRVPLQVTGGPMPRVRVGLGVLAGGGILLVGTVALRRRRLDTGRAGVLPRALLLVAVALAVTWVLDRTLAPRLGALFLPARPEAHIEWDAEAPMAGAANQVLSANTDATRSHQAAIDRVDVTGVVRPVPGRIAEVIVPMPGRLAFEGGFRPAVGRRVRVGQTLAVLEQGYVLHDAVHLINQRWPILLEWLAARRAVLRAEATMARTRYQREHYGLSEVVLKEAEAAAELARHAQSRADAVLRMHDAQITAQEPVRRPLEAPISGTIISADFTQGQMVYENHKLFTIVDFDSVWVELKVPEPYVPIARRVWRQSVTLRTPAFPADSVSGRLVRVAPAVDEHTRTLSFFFSVRNPRDLLRLGMLVSASLTSLPSLEPSRRLGAASRPERPDATNDASAHRGSASAHAASSSAGPRVLEPRVIASIGTVRAKPELQARVVAPIWGRIEFVTRALALGDRVRKGEPLVRLVLELPANERYPMHVRAEEIRSELEQAKTRRQQAEWQYRRSIEMLKGDSADPFWRQEVELTEQIFQATVKEEELLNRQVLAFEGVMKRRDPRVTIVEAPIAGVLTDLAFTPGQLNPTDQFQELCTITDMSIVWLEADVFEADLGRVLGARRAYFRPVGSDIDRPLSRLVAISGAVDERKRTVRVIYEAVNDRGDLKLGMSGRVGFELN